MIGAVCVPSRLVVSTSLRPLGPRGPFVPGDSSGNNTGVGCHALLQGNLPSAGIEPRSPTLQADSLPSEPPGKPQNNGVSSLMISTVVFNWLVPQWWKEGLGFEPRSPKSLSFYHCLPLEGRLWNRCQRCSFPDWEAGGNCLCKRQLVRKKSELDWVPRQLTLADPHGVASCHHPGLDQAGCVLQRHASQNSLSGFTTVHPNSLARAVT